MNGLSFAIAEMEFELALDYFPPHLRNSNRVWMKQWQMSSGIITCHSHGWLVSQGQLLQFNWTHVLESAFNHFHLQELMDRPTKSLSWKCLDDVTMTMKSVIEQDPYFFMEIIDLYHSILHRYPEDLHWVFWDIARLELGNAMTTRPLTQCAFGERDSSVHLNSCNVTKTVASLFQVHQPHGSCQPLQLPQTSPLLEPH